MQISLRVVRRSLSLLLLGVSCAAGAAPHAEYRVTIVGPPGSQPTDINQSGAVVGIIPTGITTYRSFVNYGRGPIDLAPPGGVSNTASAINDRGEVLGNWSTPDGQRRGYVYYRGSFRQIAGVKGRPTAFMRINNAGYILVSANEPPAPDGLINSRIYLRAPNGRYRDLGAPPYIDPVIELRSLNNRNQVAGQIAPFSRPEMLLQVFVWTKGVLRQLDSFGYTPNYGLDINDRGQVAGSTATEEFRESLATIWTHGRPTRIDTRPSGNFPYSVATFINNHGHATGDSDYLGLFIYRGRKMESLNSLINPGSGWTITQIHGLNDAGQIAASGIKNGLRYAVRLDLIRPHALGAPYIEPDDETQADEIAQQEEGDQ